jgi:predicted RNA binding protein YcfA (HicA-like mRNA interferase family)
MNSREIIRRLEGDDWYRVGQRGSQVQFKYSAKPGWIDQTVSHPEKDIPTKTLGSIERQSGVSFK